MLLFEHVYTEGLTQTSDMAGDSKTAVAAVIDHRRNIDIYLTMARERGLQITYVIETHIHADFASGAQALASRTGAQLIGGRSDAYQFDLRKASGDETLTLERVSLQAMPSPGHTPDHI